MSRTFDVKLRTVTVINELGLLDHVNCAGETEPWGKEQPNFNGKLDIVFLFQMRQYMLFERDITRVCLDMPVKCSFEFWGDVIKAVKADEGHITINVTPREVSNGVDKYKIVSTQWHGALADIEQKHSLKFS